MLKIKKEAVLVKPSDVKPMSDRFEVIGTFNPAAVRLPNGDIVLYVRVAERLIKNEDSKYYYAPRYIGKKSHHVKLDKFKKEDIKNKSHIDFIFKDGTKRLLFISHLRRVVLDKSGFNVKYIDDKPSFYGLIGDGELGIEDSRITKIGNKYYMTYVSLSVLGDIAVSYAVSKDCVNWKREGIIFEEQNKDCVLFPEKIHDRYLAFNRPEGNFEFSPPHIWLSFSPDLNYWGEPKIIKLSKKGSWDYSRIGAGPPPIKTDKGWLLIYHGVSEHKKRDSFYDLLRNLIGKPEIISVYSVGAALFDLDKPEKLIAKSHHPIIIPKKEYEKHGYIENVVFPTGLIFDEDKRYVLLFSGCADRVASVKKIKLKNIMKSLERVS